MGGLALKLLRAKKLNAMCIMGKPYSASRLLTMHLQDTSLFGKPLRALSTKAVIERRSWPREKNLGKVIMSGIGQSASLLSKLLQEYERVSEIAKVSVVIIRRLKVRSILVGKLMSIETAIRRLHKPANFYNDYFSMLYFWYRTLVLLILLQKHMKR